MPTSVEASDSVTNLCAQDAAHTTARLPWRVVEPRRLSAERDREIECFETAPEFGEAASAPVRGLMDHGGPARRHDYARTLIRRLRVIEADVRRDERPHAESLLNQDAALSWLVAKARKSSTLATRSPGPPTGGSRRSCSEARPRSDFDSAASRHRGRRPSRRATARRITAQSRRALSWLVAKARESSTL